MLEVYLRIQSKCGKIRAKKTPNIIVSREISVWSLSKKTRVVILESKNGRDRKIRDDKLFWETDRPFLSNKIVSNDKITSLVNNVTYEPSCLTFFRNLRSLAPLWLTRLFALRVLRAFVSYVPLCLMCFVFYAP